MGDDQEPTFNLRLIDAVRQYRCLYDSTDRQYRSADYKIKVWNRLVQNLGFDGDARTLYNRWKQLRDKYGKEKKKIKYHGDTTSWQYFKHLTFLDPHMVDRTQQKFMRIGKDGKEIPGGNGDEYDQDRQVVISDPLFASNLINEVRKQPCLFDIRDPKYRHSEFRSSAWSDIIKVLNYPGDISSIYKQWKKVRDRYVREKRKLRMSGASPEESSWSLFSQMSWIDPYLDDRTTQSKRKRDSDEMSEDMNMFDDIHGNILPQYSMVDDIQPSHMNGSPGISRQHHHQSIAASPQAVQQHQQPQQQHIQQHQPQPTPNPNHFILNPTDLVDGERAFALSVIADLRTLPEQARQIARAQIQSLCDARSAQAVSTSTAQSQHNQQQQQQQQQQNQYHLEVK
uniref:MADF domain-containing protein n=1 Tax=Steinernema glaseri TaxID=37863 RepID=A0A1I7ZGJ5_9BILA